MIEIICWFIGLLAGYCLGLTRCDECKKMMFTKEFKKKIRWPKDD